MSWASYHEEDDLSNVFRFKRFEALVDRSRSFLIPLESHLTESCFHQPRIYCAHLYSILVEVHTHGLVQGIYGMLGCAVYISVGIDLFSGKGADIDDMAPVPLRHSGNYSLTYV